MFQIGLEDFFDFNCKEIVWTIYKKTKSKKIKNNIPIITDLATTAALIGV